MNNDVRITGKVASQFKLDHECNNEKFYRFYIHSRRDSGTVDVIPVIVSEKLINLKTNYVDKWVGISGQFRSYNSHEANKTKLILFVFVIKMEVLTVRKELNDIFLEGNLSKPPVYRETPGGRLITDLLVATKRNFNKSDYIPCVAWGRNAISLSMVDAGTKIRLSGRIQSREYVKDGETKRAYEISVKLVELVD